MRNTLILGLLLCLSFSCSREGKTNSSNSHNGINCDYNKDNIGLCISKVVSKSGPGYKEYKIVDESGAVLIQGTVDSGEIKWLNEDAVEIINIPGNISDELSKDDFSSIYVISRGKLVSKREYLDGNY